MKNISKNKIIKRERRRARIRAKIFGTEKRPRLVVFRSNKHFYGQLINDNQAETLVAASDFDFNKEKNNIIKGKELAAAVGKLLAQKATKVGIKQAVFDRAGYKYHGRVEAFVEAFRKAKVKI